MAAPLLPRPASRCAPGSGSRLTIVALLLVLSPAGRLGSEEAPARSAAPNPLERMFPPRPLLAVSVESLPALRQGLLSTLPGRIASHPRTREALTGLCAAIGRELPSRSGVLDLGAIEAPLEILGLVRGGAALCVARVRDGNVDAMAALDLGESRAEAEGTLRRLAERLQTDSGATIRSFRSSDRDLVEWRLGGRRAYHGFSGGVLVASTWSTGLEDALAGRPGDRPSLLAELEPSLRMPGRALLAALDLSASRAALRHLAGAPETYDRLLRLSGLSDLDSLGLALGFDGGGCTVAATLRFGPAPRGLFGALLGGLAEIERPAEAFPLIPADALAVGAVGVDPGGATRSLLGLLRSELPEATRVLDGALRECRDSTGISIEGELGALGRVTVWVVAVEPRAGALLPDGLVVARKVEVEPWIRLLRRAAEAVGAQEEKVAAGGREISRIRFGASPGLGSAAGSARRALAAVLASALPVVARADLGGGFTVMSGSVQAVERYVEGLPSARRWSEASDLASLAEVELTGARAAAVVRGGRVLLGGYNTLLYLASGLSPALASAGVDVARLPPAEEFLDSTGPGTLRIEVAADRVVLRGRRALDGLLVLVPLRAALRLLAGGALSPPGARP